MKIVNKKCPNHGLRLQRCNTIAGITYWYCMHIMCNFKVEVKEG